jgi:hypothetical protein
VMIDELLSSYIVRRMGGDSKRVRRPAALAENCRVLRRDSVDTEVIAKFFLGYWTSGSNTGSPACPDNESLLCW